MPNKNKRLNKDFQVIYFQKSLWNIGTAQEQSSLVIEHHASFEQLFFPFDGVSKNHLKDMTKSIMRWLWQLQIWKQKTGK